MAWAFAWARLTTPRDFSTTKLSDAIKCKMNWLIKFVEMTRAFELGSGHPTGITSRFLFTSDIAMDPIGSGRSVALPL